MDWRTSLTDPPLSSIISDDEEILYASQETGGGQVSIGSVEPPPPPNFTDPLTKFSTRARKPEEVNFQPGRFSPPPPNLTDPRSSSILSDEGELPYASQETGGQDLPPSYGSLFSEKEFPRDKKEDNESLGSDASETMNLPAYHSQPPSHFIFTLESEIHKACHIDDEGSWFTHTIYRIPKGFKTIPQHHFVPQYLSIGPYHKSSLMDRNKLQALHKVQKRTNHQTSFYIASMQKLEPKVRKYYDETLDNINSDELAKTILIDGVYLLELLLVEDHGYELLSYVYKDPILSIGVSNMMIRMDIIKLENQIPFLALKKLLRIQMKTDVLKNLLGIQMRTDDSDSEILGDLTVNYLKYLSPNKKARIDGLTSGIPKDYKGCHILDILRQVWLNGSTPAIEEKFNIYYDDDDANAQYSLHLVISSAWKLAKAGVTFREGDSEQFWDIEFNDGILTVPGLVIDKHFLTIFLNLIAYELCSEGINNHIISYVRFMKDLVNSAKDVEVLSNVGIIESRLGSNEEVAEVFDTLTREMTPVEYHIDYLKEVRKNLHRYSIKKKHKWFASLKNDYFSSPWSVISVFAAFVLLILTFFQTFYTIFGYYKPAG